jgi:hypothetical protein
MYFDFDEKTSTATVSASGLPPCTHRNGWYQTVTFGIFRKRVFLCLDCERIIDMKELKAAGNGGK